MEKFFKNMLVLSVLFAAFFSLYLTSASYTNSNASTQENQIVERGGVDRGREVNRGAADRGVDRGAANRAVNPNIRRAENNNPGGEARAYQRGAENGEINGAIDAGAIQQSPTVIYAPPPGQFDSGITPP